jgi:DNA-directed RNA polymerase alpha subunit
MSAKDKGPFAYLAAPARRALARANIAELADLATISEADLTALHGMGPNAIARLKERMAEANIAFAGERK